MKTTTELSMIRDRLDELNKLLTGQDNLVEDQGLQLPVDACVRIARPLQQSLAVIDSLGDTARQRPPPAETPLPSAQAEAR